MGWPQFLAWAATQGFKNIKVLRQAYNSFKKFPGKDVVLKTAKNLWDDVIKKTSTKDLVKQIRNKPIIPKQLDKNFIRISKDQIDDIERSIANKPKTLGDALKTGQYKTVPTPKGLKPPSLRKSNVIPFPKKPPGKADGGSIDKALSGRSRDI